MVSPIDRKHDEASFAALGEQIDMSLEQRCNLLHQRLGRVTSDWFEQNSNQASSGSIVNIEGSHQKEDPYLQHSILRFSLTSDHRFMEYGVAQQPEGPLTFYAKTRAQAAIYLATIVDPDRVGDCTVVVGDRVESLEVPDIGQLEALHSLMVITEEDGPLHLHRKIMTEIYDPDFNPGDDIRSFYTRIRQQLTDGSMNELSPADTLRHRFFMKFSKDEIDPEFINFASEVAEIIDRIDTLDVEHGEMPIEQVVVGAMNKIESVIGGNTSSLQHFYNGAIKYRRGKNMKAAMPTRIAPYSGTLEFVKIYFPGIELPDIVQHYIHYFMKSDQPTGKSLRWHAQNDAYAAVEQKLDETWRITERLDKALGEFSMPVDYLVGVARDLCGRGFLELTKEVTLPGSGGINRELGFGVEVTDSGLSDGSVIVSLYKKETPYSGYDLWISFPVSLFGLENTRSSEIASLLASPEDAKDVLNLLKEFSDIPKTQPELGLGGIGKFFRKLLSRG